MTGDQAAPPAEPPATTARRLIRAADRAVLSTSLARDGLAGWPYGSLVLAATDPDLSPLLLLSDLADHSRNMAREPRVSLLFDGTAGAADPLTAARLSLLGRVAREDAPGPRARFLARHPSAERYAGFGDFHLYRVAIEAAHLVAGFGRIHWLDAAALAPPTVPAALAEAEPDIVAHMNQDHAEALDAYATRLLGRAGTGWRMTGIDAEGCDLRRDGEVARLDFPSLVEDAEGARAVLVRLVKEARAKAG
jgi:putative heme iron utilization protein